MYIDLVLKSLGQPFAKEPWESLEFNACTISDILSRSGEKIGSRIAYVKTKLVI
jgi:hypothetical protein